MNLGINAPENKVNEYGFLMGSVPAEIQESIGEVSRAIQKLFDLDPMRIGSGVSIRCQEGKTNMVGLNENNIIEIVLTPNCDSIGFAYAYALALVHMEFNEFTQDGFRELLHTRLHRSEVNQRITGRWKQAELGIDSTLNSVLEDNKHRPNQQEIKYATAAFHGSLDTAMPLTSSETLVAIQRMQKSVERCGAVVDHEKAALLAMFVNMRAECVRDLEKISMSQEQYVTTQSAYLNRITEAKPGLDNEDLMLNYCPIVLASLIANELGHVYENKENAALVPSPEELNELYGRAKEAGRAFNGETVHPTPTRARRFS